jgi:hypothetical protein
MKKSSNGFSIEPFGKGRNAIQSAYANELVDGLNTLGNITIARGKEDKVFYSDAGVSIQLKNTAEAGGSGGVVGAVKAAKITSVNTDSLAVTLWDDGASTYSGESVLVAKPYQLRNASGETIWSVVWTYSYTTSQERTRTATGFAATKQRVFPDYRVNDEIYVADTGEDTGVTDVTYIDINTDARRWLTETEGCDSGGDPIYAFVDRSQWVIAPVGSNFD